MLRRVVVTAGVVLAAGAALAGVPRLISRRGWAPLVRLAGAGDSAVAVRRLRTGADTVGVALRGLQVDPRTRAFLDRVGASLEDFDLAGFYAELPEREGTWREVRVTGRRAGRAYRLGRAAPGTACAVSPAGPLGSAPGDLAIEVRACPRRSRDDAPHYLLRGRAGLGIGATGWGAITAGLAETARLIASGDPYSQVCVRDRRLRPSTATRSRIVDTHPHLRREDIEVLGVLWEAFPHLADVLLQAGRLEDVLVLDVGGDGRYQQIRGVVRLDPPSLEAAGLGSLADCLRGMGPLLHAQVVWVDGKGRQVARSVLDTRHLTLSFEGFVRDGRLLPVEDGKVLVDLPPDPPGPRHLEAQLQLRARVNGIEVRVDGLRAAWTYTPGPHRADVTSEITHVPSVTVTGCAFGVLPAWAIDVVIPGNLADLVRGFFAAACRGNDGKGIRLALHARQGGAGRGPGTLSLEGGIEAKDSLLIRLGMRIVSRKLFPDADARADLHTLLLRLQDAFVADLDRYDRLTRR